VWLAGWLLQMLVVQQAAVLSMFPCIIFATWGASVFRALLLPSGLLVFALPIGSSWEPWLQSVTTALITAGLYVAGIPFHRQDTFITLGSGTWEVATDCAGLRYLLPGLALGYVYASLLYQRVWVRVWFLVLCASVLIVANGVRAYGIVLSDYFGMLDGTDHRVFSYSVYAVTILALGCVGSRWSETEQEALAGYVEGSSAIINRAAMNAVYAVGLLALCPILSWVISVPRMFRG
jgi:exosortase